MMREHGLYVRFVHTVVLAIAAFAVLYRGIRSLTYRACARQPVTFMPHTALTALTAASVDHISAPASLAQN